MNGLTVEGVIGWLMAKPSFRNIQRKSGVKKRTGAEALANAHGLLPEPVIATVPERIDIEDYRDYNRPICQDGLFRPVVL